MSIFVQIASYRDPLLASTIRDLIEKARDAGNLRIVVCNQFHPDDLFNGELEPYRKDERVRIIDVPYMESKGVCWARNLIQKYYADEEYTLHIDSHMRFIPDWDSIMIGMLQELQQQGSPKPILTTYPAHFDPEDLDLSEAPANRIILTGFHNEEVFPMCWPAEIPDWKALDGPIPARFYAGGFSFTLGSLCREVPHDPGLYFWGEEINIAVRAYTHGYDLFHPHINVVYHNYNRLKSVKHWTDHGSFDANQIVPFRRLRKLFDPAANNMQSAHLGVYGLGRQRTLRDYEKYTGLLLSEQKAQEYTLKNLTPPNPDVYITEEEWLGSFLSHVDNPITIPCSALKEKDYQTAMMSFTANNHVVHERCYNKEEMAAMIRSGAYEISLNFSCKQLPDAWALALYRPSKGWSTALRGRMPYFNKSLSGFSLKNCSTL
jgi:glycosyltransferase involved in cell wall biosynthesis